MLHRYISQFLEYCRPALLNSVLTDHQRWIQSIKRFLTGTWLILPPATIPPPSTPPVVPMYPACLPKPRRRQVTKSVAGCPTIKALNFYPYNVCLIRRAGHGETVNYIDKLHITKMLKKADVARSEFKHLFCRIHFDVLLCKP